MRLIEIQNGLSFSGKTRNRNYHERCDAADKIKNIEANSCNCCGKYDKEKAALRLALENACNYIATMDTFSKSSN